MRRGVPPIIVAAIFAAFIFLAIFTASQIERSDVDTPGNNSAEKTAVDNTNDNDDGEEIVISDNVELSGAEGTAGFKEIVYDTDPTMYGKTAYYTVEAGDFIWDINYDYMQLEPLTYEDGTPQLYSTGHQIYQSKTDGEQYIISGKSIIAVSFTSDNNANNFMREEDTGKRIHMFGNVSDLEYFKGRFEAAQRILKGESQAPENAIILDGVLTDFTYTEENGEMYFNLADIAYELSSAYSYFETDGILNVSVNDWVTISVPTTMASSYVKEYNGVAGERYKFESWNGEDFETWAPVLDPVKPEISAKDAQMMFGWGMYTDGNTLCIVSDPLNVSSLAAIREFGDLGIKAILETDDDGSMHIRAYSSSGELLWEKPFTEAEYNEDDDTIPDAQTAN